MAFAADCRASTVLACSAWREQSGTSATAARRLGLSGGGRELGDVKSEIRNPKSEIPAGVRHSEFLIPNS